MNDKYQKYLITRSKHYEMAICKVCKQPFPKKKKNSKSKARTSINARGPNAKTCKRACSRLKKTLKL